MADWKQIQARIRKAKNSSDPVTRLSELYAKTHDGMAAFEVGAAAEKAGRLEEAVHWYTVAHGRFRRAEWRNKAVEALTRLGAPIPEQPVATSDTRGKEDHAVPGEPGASASDLTGFSVMPDTSGVSVVSMATPADVSARTPATPRGWLAPESQGAPRERGTGGATPKGSRPHAAPPVTPRTPMRSESAQEPENSQMQPGQVPGAEAVRTGNASASPEDAKRRRRGRRGGRGRGRQGKMPAAKFAAAHDAGIKTEAGRPVPAERSAVHPVAHHAAHPVETSKQAAPFVLEADDAEQPAPLFTSPMHQEKPAAPYRQASRSRLADPGVSSRLAQLEALLRRLISAPEHPLSDAEEAPAGPGVFVLSDSDLVTFYYVESCRTLRVAIANLAKGRNARTPRAKGPASENSPIRARLSEHLDIGEAKASQYLKQHCVVRWLQLDDEAHHLAHLAIAVLRPPLNSE